MCLELDSRLLKPNALHPEIKLTSLGMTELQWTALKAKFAICCNVRTKETSIQNLVTVTNILTPDI